MKRGIYGGTFNPVHKGHISAAISVFEKLELDEIVFIPVFLPPHKEFSGPVSSADRIRMLDLSLEGIKNFHVSDIEILRKGKSYTIDTLEAMQVNSEDVFVFIMGTDSFMSFTSWYRWQDILKISEIAVVSRPGFSSVEIRENFPVSGYVFSDNGFFEHKEFKNIYIVDIKGLDISSTRIRNIIEKKESVYSFVPEKAAEYIYEKGLYK